MMTILGTLGRDAETRFTQSGTAVTSFSVAYNYGNKGADGNLPTQWIELSLWGKQGESLAQYLTKGKQLMLHVEDVHIEEYTGRDGTAKAKLAGKVNSLKFTRKDSDSEQKSWNGPDEARAAAKAAPKKPAAKPAPVAAAEIDEDLPF